MVSLPFLHESLVKADTRKVRRRQLKKNGKKGGKEDKKADERKKKCKDPSVDINLLDYSQWQAEKGYWLGEYTFLKGDGNPFESSRWNYPYDHYKGFITGEVFGNSYRQRNVFLYPPQDKSKCVGDEGEVVGDGECGVNGNTKVFKADQSAITCPEDYGSGGDIAGLYQSGFFSLPTTTELVGKDNALLYQVFIPGSMTGKEEDELLQSQLTTITKGPDGRIYRTRTAQGFDTFGNIGQTSSTSYYRERKVTKDEFYNAFYAVIKEYNIREEDLCMWDSNNNAIPDITPSLQTCEDHLEESFALQSEKESVPV